MTQIESSTTASTDTTAEHFDVLIVGAGISGVGAAYHLQDQYPEKSFVVLEKFASFGGTWLTHTYPGIRSDSDLYTFGYRFKPWVGPPIATAGEILSYMGEVIEENDLGRHIRYHHAISSAEWSSDDNTWTLHGTRTDPDTGEETPITFTTNFLWMCQGYYRHEKGYTPDWPGMDDFDGEIIHPQTWPSDVDLSGKQVLVIGSGATAATLVPAIADECEHVTMLQRSPTYFFSRPNVNEVADMLRDLDIPEEWTHEIVRRKALKDGDEIARMSFEHPEMVREELINLVRENLDVCSSEVVAFLRSPHAEDRLLGLRILAGVDGENGYVDEVERLLVDSEVAVRDLACEVLKISDQLRSAQENVPEEAAPPPPACPAATPSGDVVPYGWQYSAIRSRTGPPSRS